MTDPNEDGPEDTEEVRFRLPADKKQGMEREAKENGLTLTGWARMTLLRALKEASK